MMHQVHLAVAAEAWAHPSLQEGPGEGSQIPAQPIERSQAAADLSVRQKKERLEQQLLEGATLETLRRQQRGPAGLA